MKVFKFGGASIRNANAIRNMSNIIKNYGDKPLVVVVSAMGKTTSGLEKYINAVVNKEDSAPFCHQLIDYHLGILSDLFTGDELIFKEVEKIILQITQIPWDAQNYGKYYDSVVSVGEVVSSKIISAYFTKDDIPNMLKKISFIIFFPAWSAGWAFPAKMN